MCIDALVRTSMWVLDYQPTYTRITIAEYKKQYVIYAMLQYILTSVIFPPTFLFYCRLYCYITLIENEHWTVQCDMREYIPITRASWRMLNWNDFQVEEM